MYLPTRSASFFILARTSCASQALLGMMKIMKDAQAPGEFEGGGVAPLRGSAERSEAPRGELDSPLEVSRL